MIGELERNPHIGDAYGHGIFKVRVADKSKGAGKSGGFRVMYYHLVVKTDGIDVLLLSIFNKSERSTIKKDEALKLLAFILEDH